MVVKRVFDLVTAVSALLLLSPLLLLLAVLVRLDSPGPVLFRHRRIGRHGAAFDVLKFRTMVHGPAQAGPDVTAANDARITRLGAVLRRCKLDELPQLWNVLRGEMSIVGPRPEVARYVARYAEADRREILAVRPGLTDFASIEFRDEQDMLAAAPDPERTYVEDILPRKVALTLRYVRERSLWTDLAIIARTLGALLR